MRETEHFAAAAITTTPAVASAARRPLFELDGLGDDEEVRRAADTTRRAQRRLVRGGAERTSSFAAAKAPATELQRWPRTLRDDAPRRRAVFYSF